MPIEYVIALAIAVILFKIRKVIYSTLDDFDTATKLNKIEKELELQEEIREMISLVEESKSYNGGKWYSVKDLDLTKKSTILKETKWITAD